MFKQACILFVDDEIDIREKLSLSFEMEDFNVLTASSGHDAIEVLKNNPHINFIISDIKMPDGDGIFLLKYVKNIIPELKIIMLSGQTETSEFQLLSMGAIALMHKPINVDDLIDFVKAQFS
jgi:DNA-binding NtrC family response regulator